MRQKLPIIILTSILILGTGLRLFQLNHFPPELFGDEVDVGYHAYSLAHTARDYRGQLLPTYIHSFSEWRAPLLMYATVPFVEIFGLNVWGVRLAPAFFGILGIFLMYLLMTTLTRDRRIGLFAALVTAIAPWHIHYSRTAYEVTLLFDLCVFGLWCFLRSLEKPYWLIGSAAAFGLMFYTYSVAAVFVPLLGLGLLIIYWRQIRVLPIKLLIASLAIFCLIALPFALQVVTGKASERFGLISIFANKQIAINAIETARNIPTFPPQTPFTGSFTNMLEKISHNRPFYYGNLIAKNYLSSLSPDFLFLRGDPNPRQSAGDMGEYYLIFLPLLLLGCVGFLRRPKQEAALVLLLVGITPVSAALTIDGGTHATRLFLLNIPLLLLIGYGLFQCWVRRRTVVGQIGLGILGVLTCVSLLLYIDQYYVHAPVTGYKFWQYGYADSISYIRQHAQKETKILITNSQDPPLGRALFYLQYDPATFQRQFVDDKPIAGILSGFDGFQFGNVAIVGVNETGKKVGIANLINRQTMFLISQEHDVGGDWDWRKDPPMGIKVLHTTLDPWQQPLFYVITHS